MTGMEREVRAAFLDEADDLLRRIERVLHGATDALDSEGVSEIRRSLHTLKGAAAAVGDGRIERTAHLLEGRLEEPALTGERAGLLVQELLASLGEVRLALELGPGSSAPEPPLAHLEAAGPDGTLALESPAARRAGTATAHLRIRSERIDDLHARVGEVSVAMLSLEAAATALEDACAHATTATERCKRVLPLVTSLRRDLPPATYTALRDAARVALAAVQQSERAAKSAARTSAKARVRLDAAVTDVREDARGLRLLPVLPFFEEFSGVVAEAAHDAGKRARLDIRAHDVEIDRGVLARLREPLLHLIRNAVVHGIEPEDVRRKLGKAPTGTILLEARNEGRRASIRIVDDGAGVSVDDVRRKAQSLGIELPARELTPGDLLDLLARPGLTTRDSADRWSGRGVGLDVVASTIRELDGRMHLDSAAGFGCIFTLEVPISASTGAGLLVDTGGQRFVLLLTHVERIVRVRAEERVALGDGEAVRIGEELVSVVELGALLGIAPSRALPPDTGVLLRHGRHGLLVLVDEVIEEQTLVIKPPAEAFAGAEFLLGGALQADHELVPVLQVTWLFAQATVPRRTARAGSPRRSEDGPARRIRVLVVDDSMTMRTLERNILQAAGYSVRVAHDGSSALEELARDGAVDLVITDLQMPRLDGVGLCRAIRASDRPETPVVIVTSVDDSAEKATALAAGADAYLVKRAFEQQGFLDVVARLTCGAGGAR